MPLLLSAFPQSLLVPSCGSQAHNGMLLAPGSSVAPSSSGAPGSSGVSSSSVEMLQVISGLPGLSRTKAQMFSCGLSYPRISFLTL